MVLIVNIQVAPDVRGLFCRETDFLVFLDSGCRIGAGG
ncbi:hypothetical protein B4135_3261 [Caldibacillus debilis]|uniref:Uncharacterized protein n=1 Tax=Caldibacillus debilis TaxID=301148 RepID=A0A150LGS0_9BACI|nr:hypothetical protein B4135_3261 [Caldibacillus debilis]